MHNFGNIGNNLERLAYKHVLEHSIQKLRSLFWICEKHNMGKFSAYLVGSRDLLRINTSLKIERVFLKEYNSAIHG